MNLYRPQKPYRFRPPRHAWWFRPILQVLNAASLRWKFNIRRISIRGDDALERLVRDRQSVLVTPNHADHADPGLMVSVGRRRGLAFHFMAARECFELGAVGEYVLQRSGAFSVDREGADLASVKTAIGILREGRHPLVIFPEGEIYHHQEELDAFNDGVASIVLHASDKLPEGRRAFAVPTSIRITHDPGVADTFGPRMDELEKRLTWKPNPKASMVDRIYRYGSAILALKEEEFMGRAQEGELVARIQNLQHFILEKLEQKHGAVTSEGAMTGRIKALRHGIRLKLNGKDESPSPAAVESLYDDLDQVFVAQQLYSYPGQYVQNEPTVDRIAETLFKLEEDVLGVQRYPAPRRAEIVFGEPVDVRNFVRDGNLTSKSAVRPLTEHLHTRIQSMLERPV